MNHDDALMKYDTLVAQPFPCLTAGYQAPVDDKPRPEPHLHAGFYPPYRAPDKLKYRAGTELAAGLHAMDALPEDKARELQQVRVDIDRERPRRENVRRYLRRIPCRRGPGAGVRESAG